MGSLKSEPTDEREVIIAARKIQAPGEFVVPAARKRTSLMTPYHTNV
jgi:hypothetical protein